MYARESLNKFLNDLGSESSTPGGGSAAALAGALTASVVAFIANLTIGKKKYKDVEEEAEEILEEALQLKEGFLQMIDEDSDLLKKILAGYRQGDQNEISQVCKQAVVFSLKMTEECFRLLGLALHISIIGNRMLTSDFEVAAYLGEAAVNSAIANVKINLGSIKDEEFVNRVREQYQFLAEKAARIKEEIVEIAS